MKGVGGLGPSLMCLQHTEEGPRPKKKSIAFSNPIKYREYQTINN